MKNQFVGKNSSPKSLSLTPNFSWVHSRAFAAPTVLTVSARASAFSRRPLQICAAATLGLLILATSTRATPYACDITNNNAGVVSFRLNENADNVRIIHGSVTNDLGPGLK